MVRMSRELDDTPYRGSHSRSNTDIRRNETARPGRAWERSTVTGEREAGR